MPEAENAGSESSNNNNAQTSRAAPIKLSFSPQLNFPPMQPAAGSSSSSAKHSHTRSKSVNLSPTIGAAGPSFTSNTIRWDGHPAEQSIPSTSASHNLSYLGSAARIGSPLLRPSSPLHVNVQGVSPSAIDFWRTSPGSESGGSSDGSSPDVRRGSHFSKAMERSSSNGSIGSNNHLVPLSPRSSYRRTASPSRAYAVPISPRLQALGGSTTTPTHTRKLSGGSMSHLANLGDNTLRASSPITLESESDLPIDSVWPGGSGNDSTNLSTATTEAIPIGTSKSQSTPVPPSLRDELSSNNIINSSFTTIYPTPTSPKLRALSVSPQDEIYLYRHHRTPSPSIAGSSQKRRSSGSPAPHSPSAKVRSNTSPVNFPALAAPKPIAKRALDLDAGQYPAFQSSLVNRRHSRNLSNSSNTSSNASDLAINDTSFTLKDDRSPTQKALSPVEGAQVKLDAQNALAEVSSTSNATLLEGVSASNGYLELEQDEKSADGQGDGHNPTTISSSSPTSTSPISSSMSSLDSTKAIASAHGITSGKEAQDLPNSRISNLIRPPSLTNLNGNIVIGPDGNVFRARSPAISPRMETIPLGESPPKTRSFIGMPPRSGYDLSDDPDDVGSEDGSTGSGRESINEDRDNDDDESVEENEEAIEDIGRFKNIKDTNQMESGEAMEKQLHPTPLARRPNLMPNSVVATPPLLEMNQNDSSQGTLQDTNKKRADLALTRDEGIEEDDNDDAEEEDGEGIGNQDDERSEMLNPLQEMEGEESMLQIAQPVEESLSTLERIFLFAKSEMTYHRVLVSHSLADWILEVELSDAVEFVIPLLNGLACDENEVCTAFAPHLHRVMWHFIRNCPLVEDVGDQQDPSKEEGNKEDDAPERATRAKISVGIFTPLLCALLLNYNAAIAGATQSSIVRFFARIQGFDFLDTEEEENDKLPEEEQVQQQQQQFSSGKAQYKTPFDSDTALIRDAAAREDKRVLLEEYDFGNGPRRLIMDELLHNVALAIGNLNIEQTTQAREMTSQQEKSLNFGEQSSEEHDGNEDAIMDDIPLTSEPESSTFQDKNGESSKEDIETSQLPEIDIESGDTEMSMDFLEENIEHQTSLNARASLDNDSMTMSDVEEEVAVGRMASISLLAALGAEDLVSRDVLVDKIIPEMIRFAGDHTFFVRKEVAVAMGALARCIGYEILKEKNLLSIFERFCKDRIWHVRQAACLSLPNLFAQVENVNVKRVKVVEIMRIFVGDVSHNVRVAALDIIGETIYLFHEDPNGVPTELVRHFLGESFDTKMEVNEEEEQQDLTIQSSSQSSSSGFESLMQGGNENVGEYGGNWGGLPRSISTSNANGFSAWSSETQSNNNSYRTPFPNADHMDADRPLVMAYNFPAVILTLGKAHWPKLKEVHSRLCNSASPKARRSLAASLHEVAKIIGVEWTTENLFSMIQHFLDSKFEGDEQVKMAMLQNLDVFMEHLTLAKALESLKFLLRLWNEDSNGDTSRLSGNWRLREKLISLIPSLAKRYLLEDDEGVLVVLMQLAIVDTVSSVRLQGIKVVSSLYHIFEEHDQVLADGFLGMLVDVGENESYRGRVACIHCLAELCKNHLQRSSVEMLMMSRLVELSKDDVVDVRVALAQLVSLMCSLDGLYALPNSRSEDFVSLLRLLSHDSSVLVREITLSGLQEGDPGREAPTSWPTPRAPRQLVLGPSDGGEHRQPISESSFDMNGNSVREVQSFDMDEEEEVQNQSSEYPSTKSSSPLLQNSMLLKRRSLNRSQHRQFVQLDADSSMFEDADDDDDDDDNNNHEEEEEVGGKGRVDAQVLNKSTNDKPDSLSNQNNFLMLTTDMGQDGHNQNVTFDDESLEADEPHHLLGKASDSPLRSRYSSNTSPEHSRQFSTTHNLSLESPERPWNRINLESTDSTLASSQKSISKAPDPFLAFVADKRFDHMGNGQSEEAAAAEESASESESKVSLSSPAAEMHKSLNEE